MAFGGIQRQIIDEARASGLDPAHALSVAERESDFQDLGPVGPGMTISGYFQMSNALKRKYGHGPDAGSQTQAFAAYDKDLRSELEARLGRAPNNREAYLAHHFGPGRAALMASGRISPDTPTNQVFSPFEMRMNPHFARAGTVGRLTNGIYSDMGRREAKFRRLLGDEGEDTQAGGFKPLPDVTPIQPSAPSAPQPFKPLPDVSPPGTQPSAPPMPPPAPQPNREIRQVGVPDVTAPAAPAERESERSPSLDFSSYATTET